MPGFRTHYFFGKNTRSDISDRYSCIKHHPNAFNLGQQGPDIFFYCPPSHMFYKEHIGGLLHSTDTMAFFAALFEGRNRFVTRDSRAICDAYIMGFIGHYTLDTTVHPYVHFRTKKLDHLDEENYVYGIHVLLETDIDAAILRKNLHIRPAEFKSADTISLTKKEQAIISLLLSFAIKRTYPRIFASAWHVSTAITCMRIASKLIVDPTGKKKTLLRYFDEMLIGNAFFSPIVPTDHKTYTDPCNTRHLKWHNPWDPSITSTESVYDLMARAEEEYRIRLSLYHDMMFRRPENYFYCQTTLLSNLGNKSYDSGLEI